MSEQGDGNSIRVTVNVHVDNGLRLSVLGGTSEHEGKPVECRVDTGCGLTIAFEGKNYRFFLGTNLDNIQDMWTKGRGVVPTSQRGEQNVNAILTDEQVTELCQLAAAGWNQRALAKRFGCSNSTAWRLAKGVSRA